MKYVIDNDTLEYVVPEAGDKEIIIPDGIKRLGSSFGMKSFPFDRQTGYSNYNNITRIFIPATMDEDDSVVYNRFNKYSELQNLKEFVVDCRNPMYESIDGVLFKKHNEGKSLIIYPHGRACKEYKIPDGVTHVAEFSFEKLFNGPDNIVIVFPKSINSIDQRIGGIGNRIHQIAIYENYPNDFIDQQKSNINYESWLWNIICKDNLLITVLSMDGNIKYKIPVFVKNASFRGFTGVCYACNPVNNARLAEIDDCFEELKNKDEKLLTATVRIGWPDMLSQDNKAKYEKYVSRYIKDTVPAIIKYDYLELLEVLTKNKLIKKTTFPDVLAMVEAPQYAEQKKMLLEYYKLL